MEQKVEDECEEEATASKIRKKCFCVANKVVGVSVVLHHQGRGEKLLKNFYPCKLKSEHRQL